ncbi:hypothetical protein [Thermaurantiacus sp.]
MAEAKAKASAAKFDPNNVLQREIEISFNKERKAFQIAVPPGVGLLDLAKVLAKFDRKIPVPGGCLPCLSGHPFEIFERFDPVVKVNIGR